MSSFELKPPVRLGQSRRIFNPDEKSLLDIAIAWHAGDNGWHDRQPSAMSVVRDGAVDGPRATLAPE